MRNEIGIGIGEPFCISPLRPLPKGATPATGDAAWEARAPTLFSWTTEEGRKAIADAYWRVLTRTLHDGGGTGLTMRTPCNYSEAWAAKILLSCGTNTDGWWSLAFAGEITGPYPGVSALNEIATEVQKTTGFFFELGAYGAVASAERNVTDCIRNMVREVMGHA